MSELHAISPDLLKVMDGELKRQNHWIAYNASAYHLAKGDVYFFKEKQEATEFASENYGDHDAYKIINATSIHEAVDKITFGESIGKAVDLKNVDHWSSSLKEKYLPVVHNKRLKYLELETLFNTKIKITMNEKNFEYLKDQVKYTGFGEGLENDLKESIQKQTPKFMLLHQGTFGKDETVSTLHFKKSDQSEMYFFNKYDVTLKQNNTPESITQSFYLNKGNNITLKEAYNLMNGRAVNKDLTNKEGQVYNAWVQMDFKQADNNGNYKLKQFHQNYGFDLEKALSKLPIKELSNEQDRISLVNSLQKGNKQAVTFSRNGEEVRQYIEANPQFKSINIYDSNMNKLGSSQKKKEEQAQSEKQSVKKESQAVDKADPEVSSKKQGRRKSQSIA